MESGGMVLVCEDDAAVRATIVETLADAGYDVRDAAQPTGALAIARQYADDIVLLVSDGVMPEISGHDLALKVIEICGPIPVLLASGYAGQSGSAEHFLPKPFTPDELLSKVAELLDA
jgi:two-component system cell cycle sensor histidine kinase/response regulator CckA